MSEIRVIAENRPAKSRHAVVFCCDAKYLPYAALAIHTLVRNNPVRDFDICITSLDALVLPPVLESYDIRSCQIDVGNAFNGFPVSEQFSLAAYLRIALPEAFATQYDRIVYLDCDVFVVGDAFSELFKLDLRGMPIGACTDNAKWKSPRNPTSDQRLLGVNGPYFNSGILCIDVHRFIAEKIRQGCIDELNKHSPEKILFVDQTLLNIALKDKWAELHPAWNWQWAIVRPLFEVFIDVQIVHFVAFTKPWSDPKGSLPVRYREIARRFFTVHYPRLTEKIGAPASRLQKRKFLARLIKHITRSFIFVDGFNRHGGDITKVVLPE